MNAPVCPAFADRLLNEWQRGFPLTNRPFAQVGKALAATEIEVIDAVAGLLARGAASRLGGVWAPGAGGSALLCAMAVPAARLAEVAARVSAHPGDAVLLSPACASLDMFDNYGHRARVFHEAVQALAEDAGQMLEGGQA